MAKEIEKKVSARKATTKTTEPKKAKTTKAAVATAAPAPIVAASTVQIDCKSVLAAKVFSAPEFEKFIVEKFKPTKDSKAGDAKDKINVTTSKDGKVKVVSSQPFPKRYVKYLAKCFFRKVGKVNDIKVISVGPDSYELRRSTEEVAAKK